MKKMLFAVAIAAITFASCAKESTVTPTESEGIVLSGSVMNVETRGAGAINADFTSFGAGVVAYETAITTPLFAQNVTFVQGVKTLVAGQTYPNANTHSFVGYAPETGVFNAGVASFTIDGKDDVMYAPVVTGSKTQATAGTHPALAFTHKLTQLQFKVKAADTNAMGVWSAIKKITIEGENNTFDLDLTSGLLTATGTATNSIVAFEGNLAVTETAQDADYVMIEAGKASVNAVIVSERKGQEVAIDATINATTTFEAGKAYTITLNLLGTETIQISATVTDWEPGTPINVDVE